MELSNIEMMGYNDVATASLPSQHDVHTTWKSYACRTPNLLAEQESIVLWARPLSTTNDH